MSAYMVTFITGVHTVDWAVEYRAKVPAIARRFGAEYVAISKAPPNAVERIEGSSKLPAGIVVCRFPSVGDAKKFMQSPDYAPYRDARIAGTEGDVFVFENDADAPHFNVAGPR